MLKYRLTIVNNNSMKQNISNNIALQKLKEFEELGGIEPTSEWSRSLVDKLSIPQTHSYSS